MATKIQLRRDTAVSWSSSNPILSQGEPGYDLTEKKLKIGDGITSWDNLSYIEGTGASGDQTLTLTGDTLSISGGNSVDLSKYVDSTFSGSYNDLTDKPNLFDGQYSSLSGTPVLSTVATTGSYNDLTDKPNLFDGQYSSLSYNDLTDKPAIPTNLNDLANVNTTSPANGDFLMYANGEWVNAVLLNNIVAGSNISLLNNDAGYITAASIPTDLQGSVFADDSTLLVDGVNGVIPYSVLDGAPTALSDFSNDLDYATIVSQRLIQDGIPNNTFLAGNITNNAGDKILIDGANGKIVGPLEVGSTGNITFKTEQDPSTWNDGSISTEFYSYKLNFPTNQPEVTAPLYIGWNDYIQIEPFLPTDIGFSEATQGLLKRSLSIKGSDATDAREPGLLLLSGGRNGSTGVRGDVRINSSGGDVIIGNSNSTVDFNGATITGATFSTVETTTSLTSDSVNQKLVFTDETGTANDIDLSWAVDDTNLARLTSGTLDSETGIATFTRDDATTFTVDFSPLFDDTNLARITGASFNTVDGVLTLTRSDASSVTVDLDGRYLQSFTETNDLTSAVTWANVPDVNITESSVTQHEAALTITESQISDLQSYLTSVAGTVTGSLIPDTDISYDLGSSSNRFRDLYLSGTTIDMAGTKIQTDSNGDIEFKDAADNRKKIIAAEVEIGTGSERIKMSRDNATGRVKFETVDQESGTITSPAGTDLNENTTDDLPEGTTNLYYADSLVDSHLSGGTGIDYNQGTIALDSATQSEIAGKANDADIAVVGKSGDYNDLLNKPDLSALEEVFSFANIGAFPATGATNKVYIAEDSGFVYRWSGSEYIQLTDQTAIWGQISGTLANQTDLQNALNNKLESNDIANFETTTELNSRDTANRDRANHTGTQAISTVNGLQTALNGKQETLVSGTNIKTINNASLLGDGNIDITSAEWGNITGTLSNQTDLQSALNNKIGLGDLSASGDLSYLSASGDLSYNSTTGVFSVTTYKSSDFDTDFAGKTTDNLTEGTTNRYYTDSLVEVALVLPTIRARYQSDKMLVSIPMLNSMM